MSSLVYPNEVVVWENSRAVTMHRKFGYKFISGVKAAIEKVLANKDKQKEKEIYIKHRVVL